MCQKIDRKNVEKRGTKREKPLWKLQNFASEVHQSAKLWAESCPHVTKIACRLRNDSETTQTLSLQLRNSSLHIFAISLKKNLCLYHSGFQIFVFFLRWPYQFMSTACIFLLFLVISFPFAFIGYLSAFFDGSALLQRFRLPPPRNPGPRSTSSQPLGWAHWEHRPRRKRTCLPWPMASHGIPWHPMASHGIAAHCDSDAEWCMTAWHQCDSQMLPWTSMNFHELPWTQKQNLFCSNKRIAKYCKANAANSRNAHLHQGSLVIPQLFPLILMMGRRSCEAPQLDEHTAILDACIRRHLKLSMSEMSCPLHPFLLFNNGLVLSKDILCKNCTNTKSADYHKQTVPQLRNG